MRRLLVFLLVGFLSFLSFARPLAAAESAPVKSGRAVAQLVSSHDVVAPGQEITIGLYLRLEPHWHTYWRNAGGPGNPVQFQWEVPEGFEIGAPIWPLPKIVHTGPIVNYAFEDRLLLPIKAKIPDQAQKGDVLAIKTHAMYLVCYQVCLPEQAELTLDLKVGVPVEDGRWSVNLARVIKNAPKPGKLTAGLTQSGDKVFLDIAPDAGADFDFTAISDPYFFPFEQDAIDADAKQSMIKADNGVRLILTPSFGLQNADKITLKDLPGVFAFKDKDGKRRGIEIHAKPQAKTPLKGLAASGKTTNVKSSNPIGFWGALFAAFLGGIILNLMPCVFPVLSLKALGFARTAHDDRRKIRIHGWLYTFGVMLSFLLLAGAVIALKAAGAGVGWGFQLQNPVVIGLLAVLFYVIALNLFGMFDLGGRFQNAGAGLIKGEDGKSAFFTGVLAVIVASPCTAPFMAGAIGFAFTQSIPVTLTVFAALGAGLALPFLALSHAPGLLARLPKPGVWMETFKQALAFPMLATSVWLIWVLATGTGAGGVVRILSAMLAIGFAIWLYRRKGVLAKILLVLSAFFALWTLQDLRTAAHEQVIAAAKQEGVWSPENVAKYRAEGHIVFVDFTAAWCVSCQANDKVVLSRAATQKLFAETNTKVLIADWTRRDETIAKELEKFGRSGVPLYLVYPPGTENVEPQLLPQILSYAILEKALEKAKQN